MNLGVAGGRSLTVRVLALLSIILLPLGLISMYQTQRVAAQGEDQTEMALLLVTERAVNTMQGVIQRAVGAARGLGGTVSELRGDPGACSAVLSEFLRRSPSYSFVGFIPADGQLSCSSSGQVRDFSDNENFQAFMADVGTRVVLEDTPSISGQPVIIVMEPVYGAGSALLGFMALSVPADRLSATESEVATERPINIVTFNDRGEVLTSVNPLPEFGTQLPQDRRLSEMAGPPEVFRARNGNGEARVFARVPMVPGIAYALSSWPADAVGVNGFNRLAVSGLLPLLMWGGSLVMAFVALDRLVIRHIRLLSRQMRTFARTRRLVAQPLLGGTAAELAEIESDFRDMAQSILHDEALLEDNLREKNILLKEVHHRVKNNLQLVTSIMNMQIRKADSPETRAVLRRLQDRILGLAAVHRELYRSEDFNRIDVADLVRGLADQLLSARTNDADFAVEIDVEPLQLFPDQAVPLSMLASEAMTNAIKHAGPGADGRTAIHVCLTQDDDDLAHFEIDSTLALTPTGNGAASDGPASGGLGAQLIRAFEGQLGGTLTMGADGHLYRVRISFPIQAFSHDTLDY